VIRGAESSALSIKKRSIMKNEFVEILNTDTDVFQKEFKPDQKHYQTAAHQKLANDIFGIKENEWQMEYRLIYNSYKMDLTEI